MSIEIAEGYYEGTPVCGGFIRTKNGHDQFAIAVLVHREDGSTFEMTKFSGFDGEMLEWLVRDLRTCGWAGDDINEVELDTTIRVRVRIVIDGEYGPKLKSIFPLDGAGSGALIKKQAMPEDRKKIIAAKLNQQIKALAAAGKDAKPTAGANGARPKAKPAAAEFYGSEKGSDDDIPF